MPKDIHTQVEEQSKIGCGLPSSCSGEQCPLVTEKAGKHKAEREGSHEDALVEHEKATMEMSDCAQKLDEIYGAEVQGVTFKKRAGDVAGMQDRTRDVAVAMAISSFVFFFFFSSETRNVRKKVSHISPKPGMSAHPPPRQHHPRSGAQP